jgi:hypothetical protein
VYVDGGLDAVCSQSIADRWADGQIRYKVIIHDIEMDDVRSRVEDGFDVIAEASEICRQNGWRY